MNRKKKLQDRLSLLFIVIAFALFGVSVISRVTKGKGSETGVEESIVLTTTDFCDVKDTIPPVKRDTIIVKNYTIRNTGTDTLKILLVSPDCNCTGYTLSAPYAIPGEAVELGLEVDMRKKQIGKYMLNTVVGINTEKRLYRIKMEGEVFLEECAER